MGRIKKSMAAAVAVPLFMALLPVGPAFAAQTAPSPIQETTSDDTKVLDLGFEGNLNDMSSVDNEVTQFKGNSSYVHGVAGKALKLDQGALNLGASRKLKPDDMSLSFWWNPSSAMSGEQILMWGKGKYNENGWYLSSNSDTKPLVLSIGVGSGGFGQWPAIGIHAAGQAGRYLSRRYMDPCHGHLRLILKIREVLCQWRRQIGTS
jgi:hypothetical protein